MIDLVLYAANKAAIEQFAVNRGIAESNVNGVCLKPGIEWCWWAGTGKFCTDAADQSQALPGVVALVRITDQTDEISEGAEQWQRSKIAKAIKTNGTVGAMGSIPYYEWDGVRLFRASDVQSFLTSNNLPSHEWAGGNLF